MNDRINAAAAAIERMYKRHPCGGALRIVTDDHNVEDRHMERCWATDRLEEACFNALLPLTPKKRLAAIKLYEQRERERARWAKGRLVAGGRKDLNAL